MSGPDIPLFKRFKKKWDEINKQNFVTGLSNPKIKMILGNEYVQILTFAQNAIKKTLPRDDYKEFLELIIVFLGGTPPGGTKFRKPGAFHLARWMAKSIYSLKIYLFRREFKLTAQEEKSLLELNTFLVKCYASSWFSSPRADKAPLNDIRFLRTLQSYRNFNKDVADTAINKFIKHLYYLNEECLIFSLFDNRIKHETKLKMAEKIVKENETQEDDEAEIRKKLMLRKEDVDDFLKDNDDDILIKLVGPHSITLFSRLDIPTHIFKTNFMEWIDSNEYLGVQSRIKEFKIVNDTAERAIKLITEFNDKITKYEDQKQFL